MKKVTFKLVRDKKEPKHSLRFKPAKAEHEALVTTLYFKKEGLQATFGEFPKELTLTLEA